MGGFCFKAENVETKATEEKPVTKNRKVTVREEEMVIAKLKIQSDRLEDRIKKLEKEHDKINQKIKGLISEKKKEEAYFYLKKLKLTKEHISSSRNRQGFIENQITNIENTLDDAKFADVLKDSNRAIEKLNKEIDMEEIRIAKELQEEGKMRREELEEMLKDGEEDEEIKNELNKIEKGMLEDNFAEADAAMGKIGGDKKKDPVKPVERREVEEPRVAAMAN